ncbi:MAG: hypothetical protein OQK04_06240 [Kangiellaceae bacterium]|nr:hypothetical protein [Kangiellaceae bacterium]MCW8998297.1 hypothetical protein [Kangiellaceae bacterium]
MRLNFFSTIIILLFSVQLKAEENCSTKYEGDASKVISISFYEEPVEGEDYNLDFDVVIRPSTSLNGIKFTDGAVSLDSPVNFYTNLNFYEEEGKPIAWFTSSIENINKSTLTIRYGLECPLKVRLKLKYNKVPKENADKDSLS